MKRTKQSTFAKRERSEKSTWFAPVGGEATTQPAKHTPGPWQAVQDKKRNAYAWNVIGAPGVVPEICRLTLIDAGAQIEANAHLIAAAPAMYEALCGLLEYYGAYNPITDKRIEPYIREAKAALAQAEGRQ